MHFSASGYSHAAVRDGFLLRRLKGACVESCFKEMAVRQSKAKQPTVYRCQKYEGAAFEERADPDVLAEVWKATRAARNALQKDSYKVVHAQSTYVSSLSDETLATAVRRKTRSQGKFSVDLTVERANQTVWLETQWSEGALDTSAASATTKVEKYKAAATEAKAFPHRWRLEEFLGGAALEPPSAFGTLVVSASGCRLQVGGCPPVYTSFDKQAVSVKARNSKQEAANQKTSRQKRLRDENRTKLRGSRRRTTKKPARKTVEASVCHGRCAS